MHEPEFAGTFQTGQNIGVDKKPRHLQSARDMVFSLTAVLVPVILILAISWRNHDQYVPAIDYQGSVDQALVNSPFPIAVPNALPAGYSVTAAALEPETYGKTGDFRWRISLTGKDRKFLALWQTTGPERSVLDATTNAGVCEATKVIAGNTWTACDQGQPESRAYFLNQAGITTVVYGTVPFAELQSFIESLKLTIS